MAVMDILTVKVKNSYDSSYISGAKVAIDIISPSGANPSHYESYTTSQGAPFRFQANSGPSSINITATYEGVIGGKRNQSIRWTNDTTGQDARTASLEVELYYKPTTTTENLTINVTTLLESIHNTLKIEKPQYITLCYYKTTFVDPLKTIYTITETLPYEYYDYNQPSLIIKMPWSNRDSVKIIAFTIAKNLTDSNKPYFLRGEVEWSALIDNPKEVTINLNAKKTQITTVILAKDQSGNIISGANVSLTPLWSSDTVVTGTTNSNGLFTTNSDRPFKSVTVSKDGYFSTTENLDLNVLSQREVVLLGKSYTVYGKCYNLDGSLGSTGDVVIHYKDGTYYSIEDTGTGEWTHTTNKEISGVGHNVGYYNSAIYNYDDNSIKRFDFITDLTGDLDKNQIATKEHYAVLKDRNIHNNTTCQDWQCPTVADILAVTKLSIFGDKTENRCPKYSEAQESYPSAATWRIPFDWETNINTVQSNTSIPLRVSPYPTYNEATTNGKYIDLLCDYHTGANAGLDIIANSSAITELKQKLAGDWKYFDYLYFWTNDGIVTNNVVKQLDGTTTIKRYGRFMLFEIEMAAYRFNEGLDKLIAGQDFDMTDENNMNTDAAGSYITDGTKSMLYTNYMYFTGMLPVYNQTGSVVPVGFGASLTDDTTDSMFNITSIGGKSTEGWVYDNQYAMSMIHINRAIGLKNDLVNILNGFLVYVRDGAGEATMAETTKFIKLRASGSDSPVEDTIYEGESSSFMTDGEGRYFPLAFFSINLNLMDLMQGEMTTVEISTSGANNYAIVVS